ncbi:histone-lysine N-methyltransferase SETD1B-like [Senna tora]|uniref:Histone-lysine N-methyltransferase SETD1B-like n=1 Tax=Senna tora TaxID=362788 RepID=A0A834ST89_9FABA|nr:histone-lysine N-methyltransferase SETD1B-like [Senna tora]
MKLSSKSLLSPSRNKEPSQMSLSSSLSRKLHNNGKASPMFPTTNGKKRGCAAFENPEPLVSKSDVYWASESEDKETGEEDEGGGEIEEEERGSKFSEDRVDVLWEGEGESEEKGGIWWGREQGGFLWGYVCEMVGGFARRG